VDLLPIYHECSSPRLTQFELSRTHFPRNDEIISITLSTRKEILEGSLVESGEILKVKRIDAPLA
jgi:hypothetical protein